jgi:excisionase family DNA binding protein
MTAPAAVLTAKELAALLKVSENHVLNMAKTHPEISAATRRIGERVLFSRAEIDRYLGVALPALATTDAAAILINARIVGLRAELAALEQLQQE